MSGPVDSRNPYEPPTSRDELAIHTESGVGTAESILSVTFRLSHDDMKRALAGGFSPSVMIGVVCSLTLIGMGMGAVPYLREHGLSRESVQVLVVSALPVLALVGAVLWISYAKRSRRIQETPFETTVLLTPSELIIRDEGIAELRRSWSSLADVSHNRHRIRFDFLMFDPSTGRFTRHPGAIIPLRAFESEADASGFLARAKALIQNAKPLQVPDDSA